MSSISVSKPMYKRYNTWTSWRKAIIDMARATKVIFEGDKDICQAFAVFDNKKRWLGEWEGSYGDVMQLV